MYYSPNTRTNTTVMPVTLTSFFCTMHNTFNGSIAVSTERIYDMLSTLLDYLNNPWYAASSFYAFSGFDFTGAFTPNGEEAILGYDNIKHCNAAFEKGVGSIWVTVDVIGSIEAFVRGIRNVRLTNFHISSNLFDY